MARRAGVTRVRQRVWWPLTVVLWVSLTLAAPLTAQRGTAAADAARYAARRQRAYERLGPNLLLVQSRWTPASAREPGLDQDASFYYFTGADHLIGALLVLDGAAGRASVFLPKATPGGLVATSQAHLADNPAATLGVDSVYDRAAFVP